MKNLLRISMIMTLSLLLVEYTQASSKKVRFQDEVAVRNSVAPVGVVAAVSDADIANIKGDIERDLLKGMSAFAILRYDIIGGLDSYYYSLNTPGAILPALTANDKIHQMVSDCNDDMTVLYDDKRDGKLEKDKARVLADLWTMKYVPMFANAISNLPRK